MLPASLANNQSALLDKPSCFWALAWSNQVPITSPVKTFLLCVTFTMFCTSFLTTKTPLPLLCKQQILTHKWRCVILLYVLSLCPIFCTNELSSLSSPAWNSSLDFFGEQVWWITLQSLSQSWPNTQNFSKPTTTSSYPRNMRWASQRLKFLLSIDFCLIVFSFWGQRVHDCVFFVRGK